MARAFGASVGFTNADTLLTDLTAHNAQRSYSIWTWRNGEGVSQRGRIIDKNNGTETTLLYNDFQSDPGKYRFVDLWATGARGGWSFPRPAAATWSHIVVTYDYSSVSNAPIFYLDGVIQTQSNVSQPSGGDTKDTSSAAYTFGNRQTNSGDRNWDGYLAHGAMWNRILSFQEVLLLGKFTPFILPDFVAYYPMWGLTSPELGYASNASRSSTLTGTVAVADQPPVTTPGVRMHDVGALLLSTGPQAGSLPLMGVGR